MKNNIKLARVEKDMTQAKLAEQAQVSRQTINAMESGKYVPSTLLALKLSKILEKDVQTLFTLEESDWS